MKVICSFVIFFLILLNSRQTLQLSRMRVPALGAGYVFASSSDWLLMLFSSVVIGQNDLVLVLLYPIENRSNIDITCFSCLRDCD